MKTKFGMLVVLFLVFSQNARAGDLDWLIGCWETPDKSAMEAWVKDPDGSLSGFSVTVKDGQVIFYEVLRITRLDDGSTAYTAHPAGQRTTTFTTTLVSGTEVTFSNSSHDFPQEITYKLDGKNLSATISALKGENPVAFNKRPCET
jgi:hypothetical protein